jgi:hypothetical protein
MPLQRTARAAATIILIKFGSQGTAASAAHPPRYVRAERFSAVSKAGAATLQDAMDCGRRVERTTSTFPSSSGSGQPCSRAGLLHVAAHRGLCRAPVRL